MLRIFLFCLLFPLSATAADLSATLQGQARYYGVGFQNDGNFWSIDVIFEDQNAQIAYPSLSCHGIWNRTETTSTRVTFTEQILEGQDECVVLGNITITPLEAGNLLYEWSEFPPAVGARAVLLPVTEPRKPVIDLLRLTLDSVALDYLLPALKD